MFERMMAYANAGVRSVDILTHDEYEYLLKKENERLQEEAKGRVFSENEATEELKAQVAKRGVTQNTVSDIESYAAFHRPVSLQNLTAIRINGAEVPLK